MFFQLKAFNYPTLSTMWPQWVKEKFRETAGSCVSWHKKTNVRQEGRNETTLNCRSPNTISRLVTRFRTQGAHTHNRRSCKYETTIITAMTGIISILSRHLPRSVQNVGVKAVRNHEVSSVWRRSHTRSHTHTHTELQDLKVWKTAVLPSYLYVFGPNGFCWLLKQRTKRLCNWKLFAVHSMANMRGMPRPLAHVTNGRQTDGQTESNHQLLFLRLCNH